MYRIFIHTQSPVQTAQIAFQIRLIDTSENDQVQNLHENLKKQWIMLCTEYLFIPSPLCKRPRYYKLGTSKTVRFPAKSLNARNCVTRTLSLSLSGFFIYCFLSQHRSMVANQTKSVYCIRNIGQGRSGFSFKDYCFDNLVKYRLLYRLPYHYHL